MSNVTVVHPPAHAELLIILTTPTTDFTATPSSSGGITLRVEATSAGLVAINDVLAQVQSLRDAVAALVPAPPPVVTSPVVSSVIA